MCYSEKKPNILCSLNVRKQVPDEYVRLKRCLRRTIKEAAKIAAETKQVGTDLLSRMQAADTHDTPSLAR